MDCSAGSGAVERTPSYARSEQLVKSQERVRDLGEVFTPSRVICEMLQLLPTDVWDVHPSKAFLEPSCGDGNFLISILEQKLVAISRAREASELPAGDDSTGVQFHALEALASIYGVDISKENIIGGRSRHGPGARARLLDVWKLWLREETRTSLRAASHILRSAFWIVEHNVIVGNMLSTTIDGKSTGRELIPVIQYRFQPSDHVVTVLRTTMGDVIERTTDETTSEPRLFGPDDPTVHWSGRFDHLHKAKKIVVPRTKKSSGNGARNAL